MENSKNLFLGELAYYKGHLYEIKELHDNCELVVIQGVEENYNKRILAHINELSYAYMCDPLKSNCINNIDKYEFDINKYKCTIINGKIVVERL
jgi:hypothetical protein